MTAERGALFTGKLSTVIDNLKEGGVIITTFSSDMYAMGCRIHPPATMERMAQTKNRGDKPFVRTSSPARSESMLETGGISSQVTTKALEIANHILSRGSKEHPVGVMLPADPESEMPSRLLGSKIIEGMRMPTVGFMTSGEDENFSGIIEHFPEDLFTLSGTSANLSGDSRARGSGHHKIGGIIRDFSQFDKICIHIPPKENETRSGPSTTVVYLSPEGEKAYLVRTGSLSREQMSSVLEGAGIHQLDISNDHRKIDPFHYSKLDKILNTGLHVLFRTLTREHDVHLSFPFKAPPRVDREEATLIPSPQLTTR